MTNMGQAVDKAQIGEMSFWEHLDVLRASLIKIAIATVLCGIVAFLFKEEVFSVIHMKTSVCFISLSLYLLFHFISPALYEDVNQHTDCQQVKRKQEI